MGKSRKILNLIALTLFMGSNFLTPISYAIDDLDVGNEVDLSSEAPQDDEDSVSLGETGDDVSVSETEGIYSGGGEKNPQLTEQALDLPSSVGAEGIPLDAQNDEGETQNDEKNTNLEDMLKIGADENTPIDMLTLELQKSNQPQVQDVSTVTADIPDGIYLLEDENGNEVKTVIFGGNDTFSGVQLTIKMTDQTGYYYWGNNIAGDTTTYYGAENNDRWGGSGDTYENGFNLTPDNSEERQGPCDSGYHVPSRGERNALAIAWCNLDENCDPTTDIQPTWDANQNSGLIHIYNSSKTLGTFFMDEFDMSNGDLWSSSPQESANGAWNCSIDDDSIYPGIGGDRDVGYRVRCLRNSIIVPEVDTTPPTKPEIGCPDYDEVLQCVSHNGFCPQYDFDDDGVVDDYDIALLVDGICTSDNSFINENKDLTNNENPKLMRKTPGGVEWVEEIGGYEIQICSDSECNNVIHSGSHEDAVGHTDLSDGMYYRRVKAIDIAGNEGEWSDIWLFTVHTTPPEKPEIRCPSEDEVTRGVMFENTPQYDFNEDGEVDIFDLGSSEEGVCITNNTFINEDEDITNNKNPRLVWTIPGEEGAIQVSGYEIQICSDSGCNNVIHSGSYEEIIQNELSDGTYYWRVKAVDIFGNRGEWSDIMSFTVDTIAPAKPEIGVPTTEDIYNCILDDQYCPQYDFDKNGRITTADLNMFQSGVLLSDNTFINEDKDLTNNENPRFIRKTPGGAEGGSEIGGYEIQICSDSGCNNVIHSGSYEEIIQNELSDGTYYWRVKATDKAGNKGEWSDIWLFRVHTTPPAKPEIGCPSEDELLDGTMFENTPQYDFNGDGVVDIDDLDIFLDGVCTTDNTYINEDEDITNNKNPRLVWTIPGEEGAIQVSGYEIQICSDSGCNNVIHSGSYEEIIQNELSDGTYYWRVKAIDIFGNRGEWSDIFSFTVDQPKYTVSYVDGVSGSVFVPQITTGLLSGQVTPDFNGSTGRVNYIFVGWDPIVNPVVTGDVTYTAQWYKDFNGNGENDETEDHYLLTIHYVNSKGATVYPDYTGSYISGASYSVASTAKEHYIMDRATVSGVMGNGNITETVTYSTQTPDTNDNGIADEDEAHFTLEFTGGENGTLSGQTIWPDVLTGLTFDEAGITIPEIIPNSGYMFSGWNPEITGGTVITSGIILTPVYGDDKNGNGENDESEEHFTLEFTGGENGTLSGQTIWPDVLTGITFGEAGITIPEIIPNSGYVFGGWSPKSPTLGDVVSTNYSVIRKVDANNNGIADEDEPKSSGSSGGGGGGGGKASNDSEKSTEGQKGNKEDSSEQIPQNDDSVSSGAIVYPAKLDEDPKNTTSIDSSTSSQNDGKTYTQEFQEAYEFAKENGITTMPTIQKADMSGRLTRIQMAKMLSQYAINVLGKTPDTSKTIKFKDVTLKKNADYDNGVTLAYQLGIMGQNMKNNKFRPDDEVTRAEFATALSRLLYNTSDGEYKSTSKYYIHHMEKLVSEGIITKDDPKMKERRGYVMIMLMRSVK